MKKVIFQDIGEMSYQEAWDYQTGLHNEVKNAKLERRHWSPEEQAKADKRNYLVFCEHPPVYTLGKSGSIDHLLLNEKELKDKDIEFLKSIEEEILRFMGEDKLWGIQFLILRNFLLMYINMYDF